MTADKSADTTLQTAIALHNQGLIKEAVALYQQLLERDCGHFDAIHLMGVAANQLGEHALAEKLISSALSLKPDSAEACNNLGSVLTDQGRYEESLQYYLNALKFRPQYSEAYGNLGNALIGMGRLDEARACYSEALNIRPDFLPAYVGFGWVSIREYDIPAAEAAFQYVLSLEPRNAEALQGLAISKLERGNPEQALPYLQPVLALSSTYPWANELHQKVQGRLRPDSQLRETYYHGGMIDEAEALARTDMARENTLENHNFLLKCYLASPRHSDRDYFEESRTWSTAHVREELLPQPGDFDNERSPDRRLRVGIVGDYFDTQISTQTLYPFFRQYDRERLEFYCYNFGGGETEIRPVVDHYRDIRKLDNQQFFDLMRADKIDIMLDINGRLRTPNFFDAMVRQPAPIIVNWYNLTASVGTKAYNYLIADEFSVRPEDENLYLEKVFRMPNGTISAWDMGTLPKVPGPPMLQNGYPTFGCFGDFFKVNPGVLTAWAELLKRVPHSRLYLKSNNLRLVSERNRVAEFFRGQGITDERLILEGPSPYPIMKKLYALVDVALDTFPYSSGSSTINALWQGVPVVTIAGGSWRERNTASILVGAGLERYMAGNLEGYLQKAEALAGDSAQLADLRAHLGEYLLTTPQWQTRDFAVNFETRLRMIWKDWLSQAH